MTPLYLALLAEDPEKYGFTLTQLRDWATNLQTSIAGYLSQPIPVTDSQAGLQAGKSLSDVGQGTADGLANVLGKGRVKSGASLVSNHQDEHVLEDGGEVGDGADGADGEERGQQQRIPILSSRYSSTPAAAAAASLRALSLLSDMDNLSTAGGVPPLSPTSSSSHSHFGTGTSTLTNGSSATPIPFHLHPSAQSISHLAVPPYNAVKLLTPGKELYVECAVRSRIPTEDKGEFWVHLYVNNRDQEHHLAIVYGNMRSRTVDLPRPGETEFDRISRGACPLEKLAEVQASTASWESTTAQTKEGEDEDPSSAPLARIHSACFTGETILSARCDCAEQLHTAMRAMHEATSDPTSPPGVILYMRQEGRGIGLPNKLRAYNLQDLGHDTVTANLLLDLPEDGRRYDIAAAMLRDLGVGRVRLMTNNPAKIKGVQEGGVRVVERRGMVPERWKRLMGVGAGAAEGGAPGCGGELHEHATETTGHRRSSLATAALFESTAEQSESPFASSVDVMSSPPSAGTAGGASDVERRMNELDKYLVTKIARMGHVIEVPRGMEGAVVASGAVAGSVAGAEDTK